MQKLLDIVLKTMYGIFWVKNVSFMFLEIYGTMYITFIEFILMNENICRPNVSRVDTSAVLNRKRQVNAFTSIT